jgi:PQQ-like domain
VAAAVLAVALTALSADRSGAPDAPVTMSTDAIPLAVVGDTVYASPEAGARLSAYSLRTGRRRWTVAVPPLARAGLLPIGPDVVLTSWDQSRTVAVDRRTGAVRWQRTGSVAWSSDAGDRIALVTQDPADDGPNRDRLAVTVVSTASGAAAAELSRTGPISLVFTAGAGRTPMTGVFVRDDSAGGRLFDYAAGQVRRLSLPQPPAPSDPDATFAADHPQYEAVLLAGDHVLVSSAWGERTELTGYAGYPLRPLWTVPDLMVLQG